jgi:hypothetical protein
MRTTGRITTVPIVSCDAPGRDRREVAVAGNSMMVAIIGSLSCPEVQNHCRPPCSNFADREACALTIPMPHLNFALEKQNARHPLSRKTRRPRPSIAAVACFSNVSIKIRT